VTDQLQAPVALRPAAHPTTCQLYVVRHGTTTMNVENRYRGRRDVPLDAQGYQDAVDAARLLSHVGLTSVYTGPLRRTIATAQIIADEARIPDLRILHGLNNVDYGAWEGMTSEEAARYAPDAFQRYRGAPDQAVCPSGERLRDAQERMIGALQLIGRRHPGETVVGGEEWRIPVGRGSLTLFHATADHIELQALPEGDDVD
jgi:broad specificity phosphatase PhoE